MLVAGRYLLVEAVGQGGMGRVWRGHDQLLDRVVAVKEVILPPQSPEGHAELVARMMREARAAARLDHPGVVTIHDVVEYEGSPWIVMQFVAGASLRASIDKDGRLSWQRVADIGRQVAEALVAAHAAGIIHRDLKPDNILLSGSRAIVTDFGIARIADATTQLTGTGVLIGTPGYMAPESLDGGTVGPAGDMWALGATLYAAVEGVPPFTGQTMATLITAILTKTPARPQHAGPLLDVLSALLDKNPAQRPDAEATARALAACAVGQAGSGPAVGVQPFAATARAVPDSPFRPTAVAPPGGPRTDQFHETSTDEQLRMPSVNRNGFGTVGAARPTPPLTGHLSFPGRQASPPSAWPATKPQPPGRPPGTRKMPGRRPGARSVLIVATATVVAVVIGTLLALPGHSSQPPGATSSAASTPVGQHASASGPTATTSTSAPAASPPTPAKPPTASLIATLSSPSPIEGSSSIPAAMAFGPDGMLAAGDYWGGHTYLWNTTTKSLTATLRDPYDEGAGPIAFGADGTLATADGAVYLWNTTTKSLITVLPAKSSGDDPVALAFSPDGTLAIEYEVAGPVEEGYIELFDVAAKKDIATFTDPDVRAGEVSYGAVVSALAFEPDGTLVAGDVNGNTYLWDTTTRSIIATLTDPNSQGANSVALGPDGTLAVADGNGNTYLWDTTTKSIIATLPAPAGYGASSVAFGPDSTLAVGIACPSDGACGGGTSAYVWNTATKSVIATLTDPGSDSPNNSVAFGPDGTLAVGGPNGDTYLWRIPSGTT